MYSTVSMLRTIELILGLAPMSQFDAGAAPMLAAFTDTANVTEMNRASAYRARDSQGLALDRPDAVDPEVLNTILWHAIKGPGVRMPPPKTAFRPPPRPGDD